MLASLQPASVAGVIRGAEAEGVQAARLAVGGLAGAVRRKRAPLAVSLARLQRAGLQARAGVGGGPGDARLAVLRRRAQAQRGRGEAGAGGVPMGDSAGKASGFGSLNSTYLA